MANKIENIKCNKCGIEIQFALAIDNWCIIDGKNYCMKCQEILKVGWYDPKFKENGKNNK